MGAIGQGPSAISASRARLDLLRSYCAERGIGVFSVRSTSDIAWLTAFEGVFDDERAHVLVVGRDAALLHTDSRYGLAARNAAAACGDAVQVSEERISHARSVARLLAGQLDACPKAPNGADDSSSVSAALGIEDVYRAAHLYGLCASLVLFVSSPFSLFCRSGFSGFDDRSEERR